MGGVIGLMGGGVYLSHLTLLNEIGAHICIQRWEGGYFDRYGELV